MKGTRAGGFWNRGLGILVALMLICSIVFSGCGLFEPVNNLSAENASSNAKASDPSDTEDMGNDAGTDSTATATPASDAENNTNNNSEAGDEDTVQKDGGSYTLMVYICAADLESEYGLATDDLIEMADAGLGDAVNVIVETGGTYYWQNSVVSGESTQRYKISDGDLELVEDDLGLLDMTDPSTLSDFVTYCASEYPADRYGLILWDHGGGAVSGFGYDENFTEGSMEIDEIDAALEDGGVDFEFVGFDACLMSTVETAFMLSDHANYLIASEELEPGGGWYYTNALNALAADPNIDTVELGKIFIDDFVEDNYGEDSTLAITNLSKMDTVYEALCSYFTAAKDQLDQYNYGTISQARSTTKEFGDAETDHVDLQNLAENLQLPESAALIAAIEDCVEYHACSENIRDANGLSVYFPYTDLYYFNSMLSIYSNIGMDSNYSDFLSSFVTIMLGGQSNQSGYNSTSDAISGYEDDYSDSSDSSDYWDFDEADYSDWDSYDWFDVEDIENYEDYYNEYTYSDELIVDWKDDHYALALSDEDWDIVSGIECQVLIDDGEGYIDLGSDNVYEFDDDGDLMITFDNTWVAIEGQTVCYYMETEESYDDGSWYTSGYCPAMLNDDPVDIILEWSDVYPYGRVVGARQSYGNSVMSQTRILPLRDGDVVDFLCDYYTYDGEYDDYYYFGESLYVGSEELEVSYEDVGSGDCLVCYMITDIYQNQYWTEYILFYE